MKEANFSFDQNLSNLTPKSNCYTEMASCASKLAKQFPNARVDFYVINDRFYCKKITFLNETGYDPICPAELEMQMGQWIVLDKENK